MLSTEVAWPMQPIDRLPVVLSQEDLKEKVTFFDASQPTGDWGLAMRRRDRRD